MKLPDIKVPKINWQMLMQLDSEKVLDWFGTPTGQRASLGLFGICALAALLTLFGQIYDLWTIHKTNWYSVTAVQPSIKTNAAAKTIPLAQYHLFGINPETLRVSTGNLELHGVFVSTLPTLSTAIIATIGGEENTYQVNEILPDGSKLLSVTSDHVVIEHNGLMENLFLPADNQLDLNIPNEELTSPEEDTGNTGNTDNTDNENPDVTGDTSNETSPDAGKPIMNTLMEIQALRKMGILKKQAN